MDMNLARRTRSMRLALPSLVLLLLTAPALAGGLTIVGTALTEDGDHDGYADTNETVSLRLDVRNTTGAALTGVTVTLSTVTPLFGCLTTSTVDIGSLAIGEQRLTDPLVFVAPGDRTTLGLGPYDELSATFDVAFSAGHGVLLHEPIVQPIRRKLGRGFRESQQIAPVGLPELLNPPSCPYGAQETLRSVPRESAPQLPTLGRIGRTR